MPLERTLDPNVQRRLWAINRDAGLLPYDSLAPGPAPRTTGYVRNRDGVNYLIERQTSFAARSEPALNYEVVPDSGIGASFVMRRPATTSPVANLHHHVVIGPRTTELAPHHSGEEDDDIPELVETSLVWSAMDVVD